VDHVDVDIFRVAFDIIGGGEEGEKMDIRTKEDADHSLPYMIAAILLDGELLPRQYAPDRIGREDVQRLLRRVNVRPDAGFSRRFPDEMPVRIAITLADGWCFEAEQSDYEGFHSRPFSWDATVAKFDRLTESVVDADRRTRIRKAVETIEATDVRALMRVLKDLDREMKA
jgi:2-methylcitrate dehydratase